ncbi:hypothetical protein [Proteus phage vB_PmiP_RS51pmB]|nr:hypothetical protein [Proteus phage vB_PmiP_RS51pmB]
MKKLIKAVAAGALMVVSASAFASYDTKNAAGVNNYCEAYSELVLTVYQARAQGYPAGKIVMILKSNSEYDDAAKLAINSAYKMKINVPAFRVKAAAKRECMEGLGQYMVGMR